MSASDDSCPIVHPDEVRELHHALPRSASKRKSPAAPPPPPPPQPSRREVERTAGRLLDEGLLLSARDPRSHQLYYYEPNSQQATWNLNAFVEVHFYEFRSLLSETGAAPQTARDDAATAKAQSKPSARQGRPSSVRPSTYGQSPGKQEEVSLPLSPRGKPTTAQWRAKVHELYLQHDPSKLNVVDELLARYRGIEEELWTILQAKYPAHCVNEQDVVAPHHPLSYNPNADDAFMHRHHGDTHAASYHSPSHSRSPPRERTPLTARVDEGDEGDEEVALSPLQLAPQPLPASTSEKDPDIESPSRERLQQCDDDNPPPSTAVATPDVSDIPDQSEAEEIAAERAAALAAAREAAEKKARQILASVKPQQQSQRPSGPKSVDPVWLSEKQRREHELEARREFVAQERLRAKQRREEEMLRRASELKRLREVTEASRHAANKADVHTSPSAKGQERPRLSSPSPQKRPPTVPQVWTESTTKPSFDASSPISTRGWARETTPVRSPSPTKKLSVTEVKEMADRLYRSAVKAQPK